MARNLHGPDTCASSEIEDSLVDVSGRGPRVEGETIAHLRVVAYRRLEQLVIKVEEQEVVPGCRQLRAVAESLAMDVRYVEPLCLLLVIWPPTQQSG